jgi:hypothetical protein
MAAGQGFKTFVTGEVLTAGDVNGYLMQGINVFTNATARDAAITAPAEGQFAFTKDNNSLWYYDGAAWVASGATGDIEGVTAGVGISGGGTSGTVTVTNSMATAIDAKGDLVPGTGADTFARLAVGANDTVLTADSSTATGLKWATAAAGGMTLISTTNLATLSTVTLSSIPSTYKNLYIVFRNVVTNTIEQQTYMRFNGDTTANRHIDRDSTVWYDGATGTFNETRITTKVFSQRTVSGTDLNLGTYEIFDYANTSTWKALLGRVVQTNYNNKAVVMTQQVTGVYNQTTAISSLQIFPASGTFESGTVLLYGVS